MAQAHLDIQHTAKLARLELTDEEAVKFQSQIEGILDYMKALDAHDLSGAEPTAHAMPVYDVWREDEVRESFANEEALANAPKKAQGQFLMPRVVVEG
jgi:aspartyl-tRNA(Asn)/glutamyl-tRNA(Gln) amidotransferase subunit C